MSHPGITPRMPNAQAIQDLGENLAAINRENRRNRSLQSCHRPAIRPEPVKYRSRSEGYAPPIAARVLNDPGLTDGARRCAAKLMELAYRRNRRGRAFSGTVLYLAKCLGRSERTVQNYLAQLRGRGYIRHEVVTSDQARMCVGVFITLLGPLFPKHHREEWPVKAMNSGVKPDSQNYIPNTKKKGSQARVSVEDWAWRCMEGVYRALLSSRSGLSLPETGQPAALRCLA